MKKNEEIEELLESKRNYKIIAEDENENPTIREGARESIEEIKQPTSDKENERDAFEERLSLRERVKNMLLKM